MSKQYGTGSIELTKFPQFLIKEVEGVRCIILPLTGPNERLLKEKEGRVFENFSWKSVDWKDCTHAIEPNTTKEERAAKQYQPIIGNLKDYSANASAPATSGGWGASAPAPAPAASAPTTPPPPPPAATGNSFGGATGAQSDDLPF